MSPATSQRDVRRYKIEKLREKAAIAYDKLSDALNEDPAHDQDCVLRCIERTDCDAFHACAICGEDE